MFNIIIKLLIEKHPKNDIDDNRNIFWSGSKRMPNILDFNIEDSNILLFFKSIYYIIIKIVHFNEDINDGDIKLICKKENNKKINIE